jgi:hypothetical protein
VANYTIDTKESAANDAEVIRLSMANSGAVVAVPAPAVVGKLRLCATPFTPDVNTVKADLVAAETVLGGYPAGGYSIDDLTPARSSPTGGAVITTPVVDIAFTIAPGDTISAWWFEGAGGKVRKVGVFDPPVALLGALDGIEWLRQFLYGRNL